MNTVTAISHRDRAVLRAVAAGRCQLSGRMLLVDGMGCCDQFVGPRLTEAGLIQPGGQVACLTDTGRALLEAA